MGSHEAWLRQQLKQALDWDDMIMDGVMDVIVNAHSEADIQDVVENFMNNDPKAIAIISEYMSKRSSGTSTTQARPASGPTPTTSSSAATQKGTSSAPYSPATKQGGRQAAGSAAAANKQQQQQQAPEGWLVMDRHGQHVSKPQQQQQEGGGTQQVAAPSSSAVAQAKEQARATLAMFKQGGRQPRGPSGANSSSSSRQQKGGQGGGGSSSSGAPPERKVVNCLSCGKIYDCRNVTSDIIKFLERGGVCTFCGATVALDYKARIAQQAAAAGAEEAGETGAGPSMAFGLADGEEAAATAAAVAFKDRLVEYDRNAAQRTTVIDDQSDYFEIDANAWLTDEERAELKRRKALEEAAAAARRNRLVVTLDLLGRKVLLPADQGAGNGTSSGSSSVVLGGTVQPAVGGAGGRTSGTRAGQAGGGEGAEALRCDAEAQPRPSPAAVAQALQALHHLPMTQAPGLKTPAPVFVTPQQRKAAAAAAAGGSAGSGPSSKGASSSTTSHAAGGKSKAQEGGGQQSGAAAQRGAGGATGQQQHPKGAAAGASSSSGRAGGKSRWLRSRVVQDDNVFDEFGAELAYEQVAAARS